MSTNEAAAPFPGPATLVIRRKVKPGREAAYRSWVEDLQNASRTVTGFLGASTTRNDADEYTSIVRFASAETLHAWERSELRRQWLARVPPDTLDGDADFRRMDGLEFWFTAPGLSSPVAPSPHKMVAVLAVVAFGLVEALAPVVRALPAGWPPVARTALVVIVQVALMTYVIMPRVTRLLAGWLFPR